MSKREENLDSEADKFQVHSLDASSLFVFETVSSLVPLLLV